MFTLIHTRPDRTTASLPARSTKAEAARDVREVLVKAEVPLAGIAWRQIAQGLMESPTGETVLGIRDNHFTILRSVGTPDDCSCGESDVYDGYAQCSVHPEGN